MSSEKMASVNRSFQILCMLFQKRNNSLMLQKSDVTQSRTIKAGIIIYINQTILEIPYKYFICPQMKVTNQSPLLKYFKELKNVSKINKQKQMEQIVNQIEEMGIDTHNLFYLIQSKFMDRAESKAITSIHKHYINTLPQAEDYNYHPLNNIQCIKPFHPQIHETLSKTDCKFRRQSQAIRNLILLAFEDKSFKRFLIDMKSEGLFHHYVSHFTESNIRWAMLVSRTRQFSGSKLIPLLDLFNHSRNYNAKWKFLDDQKVVKLTANTYIKKGQQIFVSYGNSRSMQDLFETYGFYDNCSYCQVNVPINNESGLKVSIKWCFDQSQSRNKFRITENLNKQKTVAQSQPEQRKQLFMILFGYCQSQLAKMRNRRIEMILNLHESWYKDDMSVLVILRKILEKEIDFFTWITLNKVILLTDLKDKH